MSKIDLITKLIKEDKITFEEALSLMEKEHVYVPQYYPAWDYQKAFPQPYLPYPRTSSIPGIWYSTCTCGSTSCNCNKPFIATY